MYKYKSKTDAAENRGETKAHVVKGKIKLERGNSYWILIHAAKHSLTSVH